MVLAELDFSLELRLNLNLRLHLHIKLDDFLRVAWLACIFVLGRDSCGNLDNFWHSTAICTSYIIHHAEKAFEFVNLSASLNIIRVVTCAVNIDVMTNESDAIELHCRHGLFCLSVEVEANTHPVLRIVCGAEVGIFIAVLSLDDEL